MSDESKRDAQAPREKWATTTDAHRTDFARAESPLKYRAGAVALWAVGLACALAGTAVAAGLLAVPVLGDLPVLVIVVAVLVALVCALAGQRLWKKAGGVAGAKPQPLVGAVASCLVFAPMCLFFLAAKNAPGKLKAAACVAAVVEVVAVVAICLLAGGADSAAASA